jgi:hypothetical protein
MCSLGEDCGDCGPRTVWAAPPPPPGPPAPLLSHVPLSALLLLAWLFASVCARFIRAQQLRRWREANRAPVAVAVPVFTGVATTAPDVRAEAHHGAGGAPSAGSIGGSGTEGDAAGGAPQPVGSSAIIEGALAVEVGGAAAGDNLVWSGGGGDAPTVVVQGRRIDREML